MDLPGQESSDHLSAESLAGLLKGEKEIIDLLTEKEGASFLAAVGVSTSDFL